MRYLNEIKIGIIILFVLIMCSWLNSCESFTETDLPKSHLNKTAVFQDVKTATAALSDSYAQMRDYSMFTGNTNGLSTLLGNYTDELTYYGSSETPLQRFYSHSVLSSDNGISLIWKNSYNQIYTANAIIEGVENSTRIDQENRNILKGEALFIRALVHSYLLNLFGNIPYISTTDYIANSNVSRIPESLVSAKIINDLLEAKNLLPENYISSLRIRPNKFTAMALLARMYLYTEQWSLAQAEATSIINHTSLYKWQDDLDRVFLKDNAGTIWQLHPGLAGLNTIEGRTFIFTSAPPTIEAISPELLNAFENGDLRKKHWLGSISNGENTFYFPFKYKQNTNTGTSQEYSIIFRLEEQYLIRAEANAHLGNLVQTQDDINKIRYRAQLPSINLTTLQEAEHVILQERRIELFTEFGHRWFDLKRSKQAGTVLGVIKSAWKDTNILLPIPESELLANTHLLPQNPGY